MSERMEIPDVWGHVSNRWPSTREFTQIAKVAEEAGEAVGAAIKESQGRDTVAHILDELADTVIAAFGAMQALEADPARIVALRWAEVVER